MLLLSPIDLMATFFKENLLADGFVLLLWFFFNKHHLFVNHDMGRVPGQGDVIGVNVAAKGLEKQAANCRFQDSKIQLSQKRSL